VCRKVEKGPPPGSTPNVVKYLHSTRSESHWLNLNK
jgi:hypothetical protein